MAMFRKNRELNAQELHEIVLRIQSDYKATNIRFIEQTNDSCFFRGYKDGSEYCYKFDKNCTFGSILEDEIV